MHQAGQLIPEVTLNFRMQRAESGDQRRVVVNGALVRTYWVSVWAILTGDRHRLSIAEGPPTKYTE
jgi:hypothetical protein